MLFEYFRSLVGHFGDPGKTFPADFSAVPQTSPDIADCLAWPLLLPFDSLGIGITALAMYCPIFFKAAMGNELRFVDDELKQLCNKLTKLRGLD